jgi:hypothetical protein
MQGIKDYGLLNQWEVEEVLDQLHKSEDLSLCSGASELVQLVSALWVKSWCGCGTGTIWEPRGRRTSAVGSQYQRTGKGTADQEDAMHE